MKVVLFSAIIGEATRYLKHGIGMISAVLKEDGHEVELVHTGNVDERLIQEADLVGISGLTSSIGIMKDLAAKIKAIKDVPIFVGGPSATLSPEFLEGDKNIDYIYKGEGEITFRNIVNAFANFSQLPSNKIIEGEVVHDLNALPFVDRNGFEYGEHERHALFAHLPPSFYMQTMVNSRWCRKKCAFCAPAMEMLYGGIKKLRSMDHFFGELMELDLDNITLMIHDDNMLENTDWCLEFVRRMKDNDLWVPFIAQAYPPEIIKYQDILLQLGEVGLQGLLVGFESGSDRMLKKMRKGSTAELNNRAGKVLQDLDIKVQANIMFGNPTETYDEMMQTVEMYNKHIFNPAKPAMSIPSPAVYTPYPGSQWYEELKEQDLLMIDDFRQYERYAFLKDKIKGVDYDKVRQAMSQLEPWRPV